MRKRTLKLSVEFHSVPVDVNVTVSDITNYEDLGDSVVLVKKL